MHVPFMDTPGDPYALPLDELVHRTLQLLSKHTRLIVWGALLDQHLGLPRIQKVFSLHVVNLSTLLSVAAGLHVSCSRRRHREALSDADHNASTPRYATQLCC